MKQWSRRGLSLLLTLALLLGMAPAAWAAETEYPAEPATVSGEVLTEDSTETPTEPATEPNTESDTEAPTDPAPEP